ncbi:MULTISPECIES: hypothetical protein [unclassified Streptomyces]|uniref:hypothetical protein n=1 Tax=unclassified Streptomyces TaxID=2593676 RepID=UPI00201F1783|nr:hypothetical protein [Streptomyces sp. 35G-GA-8]MCL7375342.1 hypothetical protein [Streptomyces sp. 35G-GA-8]
MFRQGDVLIVPVAEETVPSRLVDAEHAPGEPRDARGRLVLALGEVTGHAHAVTGPGRLVREPGDQLGPMFLHLPEGGRVVHEEHAAIPLPKGWFRVVRQREYLPGAVRMVAD